MGPGGADGPGVEIFGGRVGGACRPGGGKPGSRWQDLFCGRTLSLCKFKLTLRVALGSLLRSILDRIASRDRIF